MSNQKKATEIERLGYSSKELAQALGVSERHVKNLVKSGDIPSVKLGERRIIPATQFRRLLEERSQRREPTESDVAAA